MTDIWQVVHAERRALIAYLATLDEDQWDTPSLCDGWTVHEVVAHLIDTAKTTRLSFVLGLAAARFDFDRQNSRGVTRERSRTPAETLTRFRAVAERTSAPPASRDTRLVEAFVHGEDIRRPLGATGGYPPAAVEQALRYQLRTSVSFGGGKQHAEGLTLVASDADVSIGGGPVVEGALVSLLLLASGRRIALGDVAGPGVSTLARRLEG